MRQCFKLHDRDGRIIAVMDDNISSLPSQTLAELMQSAIEEAGADMAGRYVAVGDAGDCVIYDNGTIDQMSDSG